MSRTSYDKYKEELMLFIPIFTFYTYSYTNASAVRLQSIGCAHISIDGAVHFMGINGNQSTFVQERWDGQFFNSLLKSSTPCAMPIQFARNADLHFANKITRNRNIPWQLVHRCVCTSPTENLPTWRIGKSRSSNGEESTFYGTCCLAVIYFIYFYLYTTFIPLLL